MYMLRIDEIEDEAERRFTVYGFDVISKDNIESYPDIFFERDTAENFIEMLNNSDIDKKQIPEIVDDIICAMCSK